jgi:phage repressor protein C with HTH and peptisase S24 domain
VDYQKKLSEMLSKYTQEELAEMIGVSTRSIQNYISGGSSPHLKTGRKIDEIYAKLLETTETKPYQRKPKIDTDPELEGVTFVPIAAQANYALHYTDTLFLNQLEKVYIPGFPYRGSHFRIFEVAGDSMLPTFKEGYHVVTEFIEPAFWHTLANYYVYVVVTETRVMLKRLYRKNEHEFVLISDNEDFYPQFLLKVEEIREIWFVKRKLDWEMSPPKRFEIKV